LTGKLTLPLRISGGSAYRLNGGRTPAMALAEALGTRVKELPSLSFKTEPSGAAPEPSTQPTAEVIADTRNA